MAFPVKVCVVCSEEFELKPDKPGFAIFGLGKLGGVALGYASDIELLFLFDSEGKTSGGRSGSIVNSEFFARLTRDDDGIRLSGDIELVRSQFKN